MTEVKFISSNYYIPLRTLYWIIGFVIPADLFLFKYLPENIKLFIGITLMFLYIFLFVAFTFYLFYKSYEDWEKEDNKKEYKTTKENEISLEIAKFRFRDATTIKNKYFYISKSTFEITQMDNIGLYLLGLLILIVGQYSFDFLKPVGPIIFISIIICCFLYCLKIILWDKKKNSISAVAISHIVLIYVLYGIGKNTYIRSYGNQIIGSYFEKPEYRTKYYIKVSKDDAFNKFHLLPAEIHVFSSTEEGETTEDRYGLEHIELFSKKRIVIEKAYWPKGGYLKLSDCEIEVGDISNCYDQDENEWYIELTNQKIY